MAGTLIFLSLLPKLGTLLSWCTVQSVIQFIQRALCLTLSAVAVNSVTVDKWSLNVRETWRPHSRTIKQKYCCFCWSSCNRSQWPAVLHHRFAPWSKTAYSHLSLHFERFIAPPRFPHSPKATLLPNTQHEPHVLHSHTYLHIPSHTQLHKAIRYY